MKSNLLLVAVGFCAVLASAARCRANLYIDEYNAARHDRFYEGEDGDFIGEGYDFSGVGHTSSYRWVTMISPTYFLTATHHLPAVGSTVTFYEGNVKSDEFKHDYVVDDYFVTFELEGLPSDLTLGRLVVPADQREAILPEDNIGYYPIISPDAYDYIGADVFVYGKADIVGMNDITTTYAWKDYWTASYTKYTYVAAYLYDPSASGKGGDEAYVVTGDSGAPSFVMSDGQLALAGTHYFISGYPPPTEGSSFFGDSFAPEYLDQLAAVQIEGDVNGDQFVGSEDLNTVRRYWNQDVPPGDLSQGDLSGDGHVGSADLNIVRANWGHTGPAYYLNTALLPLAAAVPEPSAFVLLVVGGAMLLKRRRNA